MSLTTRLLGLAFASADALVEIDAKGVVSFAIGVGADAGQDAGKVWTGKPFANLFYEGGAALAAVRSAASGERTASLPVLINGQTGRARQAAIRAFVLPQLAPSVSCAITYDGAAFDLADMEIAPLLDADAFMIDAARVMESDSAVSLAFLDVKGLGDLSGDESERMNRRIGVTLQSTSVEGSSPAQLTQERFAVLRAAEDRRDIAAEIVEAARAEGLSLAAESFEAPVPAGSDRLCILRAMRFAIEGCLKDGGLENPQLAFSDSLDRTLREAETFRNVVKSREFQVHYQPIVQLSSRAVHHFEALARFKVGDTPAGPIRMAEELALIESFDLAVAEKVLRRMRQPGGGLLKIAINVSGSSLGDDAYVENLLRMTAGKAEDRKRLIVEVTETSALADIEASDRRLAALRKAGIKVCIDDFGAGAAAFDYLRKLSVDAVKIDGGIIKDIGDDERSATLVRSIVDLCQSMKLETIAEMIETDPVADALKGFGVDYGQGWLFGKAEAEPRTQLTSPSVARRRGAVEAWG
ncbi:EAL domain-containing protein [Brevundimonas sp. SORGH_AS_0993]|uniref:EAL domain-containing protein n=1 Tax=Brevundimonas sp. SORGH_AS_0993 TaxID=3041794 RepID=UPI0027861627|nr:EAL domain-containing protein [Brevundimonas sp. SORGH_AS_0993]MDQ1153374.1 EAL domain-containing protein (putative c-di-GMP-specific phosphodiesterase class I) [Brevundimonas sp. SORGH_AS_0993]